MLGVLTSVQRIHIGDATFPMSCRAEQNPHELYLRMVQPNRLGQAPLKLQAKVVGKFMVERELDSRVKSTIRDRTQQAEKQKQERKIELLDVPLPQTKAATTKKSKSTKPMRSTPAGHAPPAPPDAHRSLSNASSVQPSRVASPRPSPRPPSGLHIPHRARLIHCVAIQPRTSDEILTMVAGSDTAARKEVSALIPEASILPWQYESVSSRTFAYSCWNPFLRARTEGGLMQGNGA